MTITNWYQPQDTTYTSRHHSHQVVSFSQVIANSTSCHYLPKLVPPAHRYHLHKMVPSLIPINYADYAGCLRAISLSHQGRAYFLSPALESSVQSLGSSLLCQILISKKRGRKISFQTSSSALDRW